MQRFAGKVATVTGAGKGIGAAIAKKLASEGAKVGVVDLKEEFCLDTVDAIREAGGQAVPIACDVVVAEQVQAAVEKVAAAFGRLDILVNNAGFARDSLIHKMSEEDWDAVLDVHLKGSFLFARAAQKYMVEQRYGRIVNTSSLGAWGKRGQANYATAKMGLQGFTKTLAIELGPFNITANCVAPGFIDTDMTRKTAERQGLNFDEIQQRASQTIPLRRIGVPEDIANVVAFLVSDDASYVTGEVLCVGGGAR